MEKSKVYFTDMRALPGTSLPQKLQKLMRRAGIADIDFERKITAIKMHFGEPGNLSYLRPNYAKAVADLVKELGGRPFLTDCNTLYVGRRKDALEHLSVNGRMEIVYASKKCTVIVDYAHNVVSMESLLETLREYHPARLVCVFGCGGNRSKDRRYSMGDSAGRLADFSILTADNSRFEKTEDIIADIRSSIEKTGGDFIEIPDRREAIAYSMIHARPGDMIAVIGKGHEDYQEVNGVRHHFSDREVVLEIAAELEKSE